MQALKRIIRESLSLWSLACLFLCLIILNGYSTVRAQGLSSDEVEAAAAERAADDTEVDSAVSSEGAEESAEESGNAQGAVANDGNDGNDGAENEAVEGAESEDPLGDETQVVEEGEEFGVEWYRPETMKVDVEKKGWVMASLTGKTIPGSKVTISQRRVSVIIPARRGKKSKLAKISRKKIMKGKRFFVANADGFFNLELYLPIFSLQLPVAVKPPKESGLSKQEFVIVMKPSKNSVILQSEKVLSASPLTRKANAFKMSVGVLGFSASQASSELGQDLGISLGSVVYQAQWNRWFGERWKMELNMASDGSGNTFEGEGITLSSNSFARQEHWLRTIHFPESWKYKLRGKYDTEWGYSLGFNYQTFPYLKRESGAGSTTTAQLNANEVTTIFTGLQYMIDINENWDADIHMQYYYPLSVVGGATLESAVMVGMAGDLSYKVSTWLKMGGRLGFYWDQQNSTYYDEVADSTVSTVEVRNRFESSLYMSLLF